MRGYIFLLALLLISYSAAGLRLQTSPDLATEQASCLFSICSNSLVLRDARQRLATNSEAEHRTALQEFRQVLVRDPANAARWADLAAASSLTGDSAIARLCFDRAVQAAPQFPPILQRAASYYFQQQDPDAALVLTARILYQTGEYDDEIFPQYANLASNPNKLVALGLPDQRSRRAYFNFLLNHQQDNLAAAIWPALRNDPTLPEDYTNHLAARHKFDSAASVWREATSTKDPPYSLDNYLFNGSFELEIQPPAALNWQTAALPGVQSGRSNESAHSGTWSLQLHFLGTHNVSDTGLSQTNAVRPGPAKFEAWVRTQDLSTNEGLRFQISDAERPARLDVTTEDIKGTNPWTRIEKRFVIGPETKAIQVNVIRRGSLKFDSAISGSAWIDDVKIGRQ